MWASAPPNCSAVTFSPVTCLITCGSGNEHLRLARLNDEIGQRRAVGRAARAWAANQRDLRNRAGKHHVGVKHLAIAGKRVDALLHARAAGIVDEDERRTGLQRLLHDFGNFDGVHFAGRAAGHREVLAGQVHQPAGNRCRAGHHAIRGHTLARHAEQSRSGARQTSPSHRSCPDRLAHRSARAPSACPPDDASQACPRRRPALLSRGASLSLRSCRALHSL